MFKLYYNTFFTLVILRFSKVSEKYPYQPPVCYIFGTVVTTNQQLYWLLYLPLQVYRATVLPVSIRSELCIR